MNRKYERLNFGEEGRARLRHEQEVPIEIRQVIRRIEERSASLLSFACRYREKITDLNGSEFGQCQEALKEFSTAVLTRARLCCQYTKYGKGCCADQRGCRSSYLDIAVYFPIPAQLLSLLVSFCLTPACYSS